MKMKNNKASNNAQKQANKNMNRFSNERNERNEKNEKNERNEKNQNYNRQTDKKSEYQREFLIARR